jgi:hypothetical protein
VSRPIGGTQRTSGKPDEKIVQHREGRTFPIKTSKLFGLLLSFLLLLATISAGLTAAAPSTFGSEQEAQQHCPSDTVVWLNLPTGIYHFKEERWYGATKSGAFVCQREADKAGDRATRNGQ